MELYELAHKLNTLLANGVDPKIKVLVGDYELGRSIDIQEVFTFEPMKDGTKTVEIVSRKTVEKWDA